ncbi:ribosomal protein L7/L12 [Streptomyces sp. NPDC048507]|uniref:ribosomal protein L7/L12 n=1 Tax=Streptomyces sp. NPDC048507 TaxID=3365560 RepID=UPI0037133709
MEEPGFQVLLTEPGERRTDALRAVRTLTGRSLWHAGLLLDGAPVTVTDADWLEAARDAAALLADAGARATVLCTWCERAVPPGAAPLDPAPCAGPWPAGTCRAGSPPPTDRVRALLSGPGHP